MDDDVLTLVRASAGDPEHTPDFAALAARGDRQRVATRAATGALAVAVAVTASALVLGPLRLPVSLPVIDATSGNEATTLPDGWHPVTIGDATFGVPADWQVIPYVPNVTRWCGFPSHTVVVVEDLKTVMASRCPSTIEDTPPRATIIAAPLSTLWPEMREHLDRQEGWTTVHVNGIDGRRLVVPDESSPDQQDRHRPGDLAGREVFFWFPSIDLYLTFYREAHRDLAPFDPVVEQIVATVNQRER